MKYRAVLNFVKTCRLTGTHFFLNPCASIFNQHNFPSLLYLISSLLMCLPVTHMRSTNSKPQPSNQGKGKVTQSLKIINYMI